MDQDFWGCFQFGRKKIHLIVQVYIPIETNSGWLEQPLTGTNFHGPSMF